VDLVREFSYISSMNVSLSREQQEWLEAEVAAGRFSSVDEAIAIAVADLKTLHQDDLAWAKPYVDEARAEVARGETIPGDEFLKWLDEYAANLRQRRGE
jgi:antitoxin ParD1/3/4